MPWLDDVAAEGTLVVHLVRNPLECARSFSGIGFFDRHRRDDYDLYVRAVERHVPDVAATDDPLVRFVIYWTRWNALVLRFASLRVCIEQFGVDHLEKILLAAGYDASSRDLDGAFASVPVGYNHRKRNDGLQFDELVDGVAPEVQRTFVKLARQFGYEFATLAAR